MKRGISEVQRHVLWDMLNNYPGFTPTSYLVMWFYSDETYAEAVLDGLQRKYILDIRHSTLRSLRNLEKRGLVQSYVNDLFNFSENNHELFSWTLTEKGRQLALEIRKKFQHEKQKNLFVNQHKPLIPLDKLRKTNE